QNFLGAYAVATRGAFFADVTVRRDWYDAKPVHPLIEQNTDFSGRGNGVVATIGYNFRLDNGYFLASHWRLHSTQANLGTLTLPTPLETAMTSAHTPLLAATVRGSKTFNLPTLRCAPPFIPASVVHEFENQLVEQFFEPGGNGVIPITNSQVGTFGQYGAGIA